jgi:hypothetical protein
MKEDVLGFEAKFELSCPLAGMNENELTARFFDSENVNALI